MSLCIGCIGSLGAKSQENAIGNTGPSYLYLFDADANSVGTPPIDIVQEDGSNVYSIELVSGKGNLLKRNGGAGNKVAFLNGYNIFDVPVKMTIKFYVLQTGTYSRFAAGLACVNSSNSGNRVIGYFGHNGNSNAWKVNTNAGVLLDFGETESSHNITFNTTTLYTMEMWVRQSDNKTVMRLSSDGGETRSGETIHGSALAQNRLCILDGYDSNPATFGIKRIEVLPL